MSRFLTLSELVSTAFPSTVGACLLLIDENLHIVERLEPGKIGCVIPSKTCFYAEEGGQACDAGALQDFNGVLFHMYCDF